MTSSGSTPLHLRSKLKIDHRRAIDRYIDYFGDRGATSTEPRATRIPSVDEQPSHRQGRE